MHPPDYIRGLDNPTQTETGWEADCPICRQPLVITPDRGWWRFTCGSCTHDEISRWLGLEDLRVDRVTSIRAWWCLMQSDTPEQWAQLLRGNQLPRRAA